MMTGDKQAWWSNNCHFTTGWGWDRVLTEILRGKKTKQTGVCKQPMKSFSRASQTVLLYLADARSFLHSLYQKHPLSSLYYFCWCWWLIHISGLTPTDGGLTGSFASDSRIHLFSHSRGTIQQLPPTLRREQYRTMLTCCTDSRDAAG